LFAAWSKSQDTFNDLISHRHPQAGIVVHTGPTSSYYMGFLHESH